MFGLTYQIECVSLQNILINMCHECQTDAFKENRISLGVSSRVHAYIVYSSLPCQWLTDASYTFFLSTRRMVASYLVHHGYCATAEAFAKSTDQAVHEELASIKNRQSKLVNGLIKQKCVIM